MNNIVDLREHRASMARAHGQARFGAWDDWTLADINYLLHELADGHWEDCGETVPGFAVATGGLHMAIAANETGYNAKGVELVLNGMWLAADYLVGFCGEEVGASRAMQGLAVVHTASKWTGGMPYCDYDIDDLDALREAILNSGPLITTRKG